MVSVFHCSVMFSRFQMNFKGVRSKTYHSLLSSNSILVRLKDSFSAIKCAGCSSFGRLGASRMSLKHLNLNGSPVSSTHLLSSRYLSRQRARTVSSSQASIVLLSSGFLPAYGSWLSSCLDWGDPSAQAFRSAWCFKWWSILLKVCCWAVSTALSVTHLQLVSHSSEFVQWPYRSCEAYPQWVGLDRVGWLGVLDNTCSYYYTFAVQGKQLCCCFASPSSSVMENAW